MASKTQIDKLGERLRKGDINEADLRMLDEYRRSFSEAYEFIVGVIRNELRLEPTGRPAKSTTSITEKLLRESIRLSQIQDIAGSRVIVSDVDEQNQIVQALEKAFEDVEVVDRRAMDIERFMSSSRRMIGWWRSKCGPPSNMSGLNSQRSLPT
jgi:hypothetical protein